MPKLTMPDGTELDGAEVEQRFAKAMITPSPEEPPAPAPKPVDDPKAQVSTVPQPGEGEDPKHSRARTRTASTPGSRGRARGKSTGKAKAAAAAAPPEGLYVQPVMESLEGLVLAAGLLPMPEGALGVRVRLQGQLIQAHAGGVAVAVDSAARHNEVIRRGVEAVTMGSAGWVLPAVMAVVPFAMASAQLWRTEVTEGMRLEASEFQANVHKHLTSMGMAGNGAEAGATA